MLTKSVKRKGILFDLDGTLWDSAEGVALAWNEIFANYLDVSRRVTAEEVHSVMGKLLSEIAEILLPDMEPRHRKEVFDRCMTYENEYLRIHGGILFPQLEETLTRLQEQYDLYVVSNCQCGYIEAFLEAHDMAHYFAGYLSAGDTGMPKGDNIVKVVNDCGLEHAVYVGDTMGDYEATMYAGLPFIHAAYGFGTVPVGTPRLNNIADLPQTMEQIEAGWRTEDGKAD